MAKEYKATLHFSLRQLTLEEIADLNKFIQELNRKGYVLHTDTKPVNMPGVMKFKFVGTKTNDDGNTSNL